MARLSQTPWARTGQGWQAVLGAGRRSIARQPPVSPDARGNCRPQRFRGEQGAAVPWREPQIPWRTYVLRQALLLLARSHQVKEIVTRMPVSSGVVNRY